MDYTDQDLDKYRNQVPSAYQNAPTMGAIPTAPSPTDSYTFGTATTPTGGSPWVVPPKTIAPVSGAIPTTSPNSIALSNGMSQFPVINDIRRTLTKAQMQDKQNMGLVESINAENPMWNNESMSKYASPGGPDTAIPWQGITAPKSPDAAGAVPTDIPGLRESIASITSRLNDVQGQLGGKLKRSTRMALTTEAGQLLGALGQMFPMGPSQALNVGKLGIEQYRAGNEAQHAAGYANYFNAHAISRMMDTGEIPSKIALNQAMTAYHNRQGLGMPSTPAEAIAMKRAEMTKTLDPNEIMKAVASAGIIPGGGSKVIQDYQSAINTLQGKGAIPTASTANPTWDQFLPAAKKANPGLSDAEIKIEYDKAGYGK